MAALIEIQGDTVRLALAESPGVAVKLATFVDTLAQWVERRAFPGVLIDGVRFVRTRGPATGVCLEVPPQVRTVRWLADDSPAHYGPGARYEQVRLAFPYIVIIVTFWHGALTGKQQLFYRAAPVRSEGDALCFPNLYNVADGYGQVCWLCLQKLGTLDTVPWDAKLHCIVEHLWSAFNRSSEVHEGHSYWGKMRHVDRRLRTLAAWQQASAKDPTFVLSVRWQPAGLTIRQVMDQQLAATTSNRRITTDKDLVTLLLRTAKP
jgi:hypothetical protein